MGGVNRFDPLSGPGHHDRIQVYGGLLPLYRTAVGGGGQAQALLQGDAQVYLQLSTQLALPLDQGAGRIINWLVARAPPGPVPILARALHPGVPILR
jgi:hypothetical protein